MFDKKSPESLAALKAIEDLCNVLGVSCSSNPFDYKLRIDNYMTINGGDIQKRFVSQKQLCDAIDVFNERWKALEKYLGIELSHNDEIKYKYSKLTKK